MAFNAKTVKDFNALPRKPKAPSGLVPNNWHFDLRYVPLDPTPGHIVFIVQLESLYIHSERLPVGLPTTASGISFFPESGKEAAPEVAKALIHSFLDGFGVRKFAPNAPPPSAPWKLTTEDPTLAEAVGNEFKRLGVRSELWGIDIVRGKSLKIADEAFAGFWDGLKKSMGMNGLVSAAFPPPDPIVFNPLRLAPWVGNVDDSQDIKALAYTGRMATVQPISEGPAPDGVEVGAEMIKNLGLYKALIQSTSNEVVREEADAGNGVSAIDYSLRLQFGINCTPSRQLARTYLVKAITSSTSTPGTKSRAHALLISWYTDASKGAMYYRYLHAAAHHANESALLANGDVGSAVLAFAMYTLEPQSHKVVDLLLQYKAVWAALEKRKKEIEQETKKVAKKRAQRSNRYICANVECVIQTDQRNMLAQCSGQCDQDKKPSYCSKECLMTCAVLERADWKNHKPFCRPGAPCSIIEKDEDLPVASSKNGALSIPVTGPDGRTMMLSSSTMGPEMLKGIREFTIAEHGQPIAGPSEGTGGGFKMDFGEVD